MNEKRARQTIVGAARFELATSWSRTKRASQAAPRPELNQHTKDTEKLPKKQRDVLHLPFRGALI